MNILEGNKTKSESGAMGESAPVFGVNEKNNPLLDLLFKEESEAGTENKTRLLADGGSVLLLPPGKEILSNIETRKKKLRNRKRVARTLKPSGILLDKVATTLLLPQNFNDEEKKINIKKTVVISSEETADHSDSQNKPVAVDVKNQPLISLRNVDVKYNLGKSSEYQALKNITLDIYAGEFVIFFGPSGCGKSTLVNAIAGLEKPCKGTVTVAGENIHEFDADQIADYHATKTGFVFQAYNLIESLSVEDNIILPQMFTDATRAERREVTRKLLDRFKILEHAKKPPVMLSGGQQQRVGIARSLVNDPAIVFADEPVGNLDSTSTGIVLEIFKDLSRKDKKTLIMVTHNPEQLGIANRIFHIRDGQIVKEEVNDDVRPEAAKKKEQQKEEEVDMPKEIKALLRTYGAITPGQLNSMWLPLKAKMITEQLLNKYSREQIEIIENVIKRRLMNLISFNEMMTLFDLPVEESGAGLNKRLAAKLAGRVDAILKEAEEIKKYVIDVKKEVTMPEGDAHLMAVKQEEENIIREIRKQLLESYHGHTVEQNVIMLDRFIRERLENKLDKNAFIKKTAASFKNNGAGFNRQSAKNFARELDLLMLIKFGEEASIK